MIGNFKVLGALTNVLGAKILLKFKISSFPRFFLTKISFKDFFVFIENYRFKLCKSKILTIMESY